MIHQRISSQIRTKIRTFDKIVQELYQGKSFNITRLTTLKSLCKDSEAANHYVFYLAQKTYERMKEHPARYLSSERWEQHKKAVEELIEQMATCLFSRTSEQKAHLHKLLDEIIQLQNTYENHHWGSVRVIESPETFTVENALRCILDPNNSSHWGYQTSRQYAERYNGKYGTGLIPESAPFLEDIVHFWVGYYNG